MFFTPQTVEINDQSKTCPFDCLLSVGFESLFHQVLVGQLFKAQWLMSWLLGCSRPGVARGGRLGQGWEVGPPRRQAEGKWAWAGDMLGVCAL